MSNMVEIVGVIMEEAKFNNEVSGCRFYRTEILSRRKSGIEDVLPMIVSDDLVRDIVVGETVYVRGSFRSFNDKENGRVRLFIYAEEIQAVGVEHMNSIHIEGTVCKPPVIRQTPRGRLICDLLVAVHRSCRQSDYIPCVLWEKNALLGSKLRVGQIIACDGRIQSRLYEKKLPDRTETRVAYEVSVGCIETKE